MAHNILGSTLKDSLGRQFLRPPFSRPTAHSKEMDYLEILSHINLGFLTSNSDVKIDKCLNFYKIKNLIN